MSKSWEITVTYPCNISVTGSAKHIPIVCPFHGYAHPGQIEVRHEMPREV